MHCCRELKNYTLPPIVLVPVAGEPSRHSIVDGRQGILNMCLMLAAARSRLLEASARFERELGGIDICYLEPAMVIERLVLQVGTTVERPEKGARRAVMNFVFQMLATSAAWRTRPDVRPSSSTANAHWPQPCPPAYTAGWHQPGAAARPAASAASLPGGHCLPEPHAGQPALYSCI